MLVVLRCGDFLKLHAGHHDAFAADRAEAFDHIAHGPLPVFVGSVGGEEALQSLVGVPLGPAMGLNFKVTGARFQSDGHDNAIKTIPVRVYIFI